MATISSLGDGGNLGDFDKIPVARVTGTNNYILGKNISRQIVAPIVTLGTSVIVNNNDFNGLVIVMDNGINNASVVLTSFVSPGVRLTFIRYGVGNVTFTPDTGVTINTSPTPAHLNISNQFAAVTAFYKGTNEWVIYGDLSP